MTLQITRAWLRSHNHAHAGSRRRHLGGPRRFRAEPLLTEPPPFRPLPFDATNPDNLGEKLVNVLYEDSTGNAVDGHHRDAQSIRPRDAQLQAIPYSGQRHQQ